MQNSPQETQPMILPLFVWAVRAYQITKLAQVEPQAPGPAPFGKACAFRPNGPQHLILRLSRTSHLVNLRDLGAPRRLVVGYISPGDQVRCDAKGEAKTAVEIAP